MNTLRKHVIWATALALVGFTSSYSLAQQYPPCQYWRCVLGTGVFGQTSGSGTLTCVLYSDQTGMKVTNGDGDGETYQFICNQTPEIERMWCGSGWIALQNCTSRECPDRRPTRSDDGTAGGGCGLGTTDWRVRFCWNSPTKPSQPDQPYPCSSGGGGGT